MTREPPEVLAARIETERARARLMDTAHRLQAHISPGNLASNAWQGAKEKGAGSVAEVVVRGPADARLEQRLRDALGAIAVETVIRFE